MARRFEIDGEITRQYRRFSATGTQLTVRLLPPEDVSTDPVSHFLASVNDLFEHLCSSRNVQTVTELKIYFEFLNKL